MYAERPNRGSDIPPPRYVVEILNLAEEKGLVKRFLLKGLQGENIDLNTMAMLRSTPWIDEPQLVFASLFNKGGSPIYTGNEFAKKIMDIEIPEEIKNDIHIHNDFELFQRTKDFLARKGLPFAALGIGEGEETEQEAIVLYVFNGITAATALDMIQKMTPQN